VTGRSGSNRGLLPLMNLVLELDETRPRDIGMRRHGAPLRHSGGRPRGRSPHPTSSAAPALTRSIAAPLFAGFAPWPATLAEARVTTSGSKAILLTPPARDILEQLANNRSWEFLFPATTIKSHFQGITCGRRSERWPGCPMSASTTCHSVASIGISSGDSLPVIGALLGNDNAMTNRRYAHVSHDPVR
jgi:hypothetical protein